MGFNLSRCIKKKYDNFLSKSKSDHIIYGFFGVGFIYVVAALIAYILGAKHFLYALVTLVVAHFVKTLSLIVKHGIIDYTYDKRVSRSHLLITAVLLLFAFITYLNAEEALRLSEMSPEHLSIIGFILLVTFPAIEGIVERFHKRKVLCRLCGSINKATHKSSGKCTICRCQVAPSSECCSGK